MTAAGVVLTFPSVSIIGTTFLKRTKKGLHFHSSFLLDMIFTSSSSKSSSSWSSGKVDKIKQKVDMQITPKEVKAAHWKNIINWFTSLKCNVWKNHKNVSFLMIFKRCGSIYQQFYQKNQETIKRRPYRKSCERRPSLFFLFLASNWFLPCDAVKELFPVVLSLTSNES